MDEDQTLLLMILIGVDHVRQSISPTEARDNLNLYRIKWSHHIFASRFKIRWRNTDREISKDENPDKGY